MYGADASLEPISYVSQTSFRCIFTENEPFSTICVSLESPKEDLSSDARDTLTSQKSTERLANQQSPNTKMLRSQEPMIVDICF